MLNPSKVFLRITSCVRVWIKLLKKKSKNYSYESSLRSKGCRNIDQINDDAGLYFYRVKIVIHNESYAISWGGLYCSIYAPYCEREVVICIVKKCLY